MPIPRKLIYAILFLLLSSCKSMPNDALVGYLGKWERINDQARGDVIEVVATSKSKASGKIVKLSALSSHFGYEIGDVKWRLEKKISDTEYEIDNLNAEIKEYSDGKVELVSKTYSSFKLVIIDKNNIRLESIEPMTTAIGNKQQWSRVK